MGEWVWDAGAGGQKGWKRLEEKEKSRRDSRSGKVNEECQGPRVNVIEIIDARCFVILSFIDAYVCTYIHIHICIVGSGVVRFSSVRRRLQGRKIHQKGACILTI
jgi:hypothetical protein